MAGISFLSGVVQADSQNLNTETQTFSVTLNGIRVVYDPDSVGATLAVSNPQHFPVLVQSEIYAENRTDPGPFIVTPPLFRLDGQQQNRLRIVSTETRIKRLACKTLCFSRSAELHEKVIGAFFEKYMF